MVTFTSSTQSKGKEGSQDYEHSMNKTSTHNVFIRKSSYLTMETKFSLIKGLWGQKLQSLLTLLIMVIPIIGNHVF